VDDFDIAQSKIGESARLIANRAMDEAQRRDHALLTNEHIFLAFAQVEWDTFSQVMRDLELNPHEILQGLEEHLQVLPTFSSRELRVAPAPRPRVEPVTRLVFKLAWHHASRTGRPTIESCDLVWALFEESQGASASSIRRRGIDPDVLVSRIATRMRDKVRQMGPVKGAARAARIEVDEIAALRASVDESAQPLVSRVIEDLWRRRHSSMREEHWILGLARAEADLFKSTLERGDVDHVEAAFHIQERLDGLERSQDDDRYISEDVRAMLERATQFARQRGKSLPGPEEILWALIANRNGPLVCAAGALIQSNPRRTQPSVRFWKEIHAAIPKEIAAQIVKAGIGILVSAVTALYWLWR
jgi:ATP-dependent Clp protease ATP-binding subunit ClpA